ncbi:MAG: AAA family ATPase [Thermodesulfobacteriota bacterium]
MKNVLVATKNVARFWDAARALEARLRDPEHQGIGLIFGKPGVGKSMFMDAYYAQTRARGIVRVIKVRAQPIWTEASMLKYLLKALDQAPMAYRKDSMFDQLAGELIRNPAVIIIDEIDAIAGSRRLISLLKDLHDMTGSSILMIGEERVDQLLRRFESFYSRLNHSALAHVADHSLDDVAKVVAERCEYPVEPPVVEEIFRRRGKSLREVVDTIREIEAFCRSNEVKRFGPREFAAMTGVVRASGRVAAEQAKRGGLSVAAGAPAAEER